MTEPPRPTDAELEILTVLWSRGPATVRDVHEIIISASPPQYTTVLKIMQIMAEKGLVRRDEKQRAHVYEAAQAARVDAAATGGRPVAAGFNGSARSLMMGALSARKALQAGSRRVAQIAGRIRKGDAMILPLAAGLAVLFGAGRRINRGRSALKQRLSKPPNRASGKADRKSRAARDQRPGPHPLFRHQPAPFDSACVSCA